MKLRPLGIGPARPAVVPQMAPAEARQEPVQYAAVVERDGRGIITKLYLPGPTAGSNVPLMIRTDDGSAIAVGSIAANGRVQSARDLPANIEPGTKLVAATDGRGRVVSVVAMTPVGRGRASPGKATRSAATSPARARLGDRYAHDPGEVLISGHVGQVLKVT